MKLPDESIEIIPCDSAGNRTSFPMFSAKFNGTTQVWYHVYGDGTMNAISIGQTAIVGVGTTFLTTFSAGQSIYIDGEYQVISAITDNLNMTTSPFTSAHVVGSKYSAVPVVKLNPPVLFNDLSGLGITTDKSLTEYGAFAVSNADYETLLLSAKLSSTVSAVTPVLTYFKMEINLNYSD